MIPEKTNTGQLTQEAVSNIDKLTVLEDHMMKCDQVDIDIVHHFAPGLYARQMTVPKGVLLTGKIHRYAHLNTMSAGDVTLVKEDGRIRVQAPYTFMSEPLTKRAFYVHEDTVWTTYHPTEETDIQKLEDDIIISPDEFKKIRSTINKGEK